MGGLFFWTSMLTQDLLRRIFPTTSPARLALFVEPFNITIAEAKIDTSKRLAAFLAQVGHESARLVYMEEIASGVAYNGRADLGNTKPEALKWSRGNPGPYFKGHGPFQITGFDNHAACGVALHPDDPEIFLRDPRTLCVPLDGMRSAGWFWGVHHLNAPADADDFDGVCDLVNRGRKTVAIGDSNGYADRLALWKAARAALGIAAAEPPQAPAPPPSSDNPAANITSDVVERALQALHMEKPDGLANP
jgi:putative chitinase